MKPVFYFRDYFDPCPGCKGRGETVYEKICRYCKGTGLLLTKPERNYYDYPPDEQSDEA